MFQHFFFFGLGNAILGVFYYFEFDCIEQFKAVEEPWPWKTDKKEWVELVKKTLFLTTFNSFVCITLIQTEHLFFNGKHPWSMEFEKIPSPFTFAC